MDGVVLLRASEHYGWTCCLIYSLFAEMLVLLNGGYSRLDCLLCSYTRIFFARL